MDVQTYHTPPSVVQQRHSQASSITITKGDISTAENALCAMKGIQKPRFGILHAAGTLQVCDTLVSTCIPFIPLCLIGSNLT